MVNRRLFLLAITFLLHVFASFSYALTLSDYFTDTWTSNNGLPHNSINAIAQTDDGYLWFATWEGVAKYNGREFKLFDRNATTGIRDSGTRALVAAPDNQLWIGGARGSLTLREGYDWYPQESAQSLVNHVLIDQQKNAWFAIQGKGVFKRTYIAPHQYQDEQAFITGISGYRLTQTANGDIYAATSKGLYRIRDDQVQLIHFPNGRHTLHIMHVSMDQQGRLLIATEAGAWRMDNGKLSLVHASLAHEPISVIEEDQNGQLWLGTISTGLIRIAGQSLERMSTAEGLPNNRVISIFQDFEGSIWVGTNGGILRLREAPFISISKKDGLSSNFVRTVMPYQDNHLLIGSDAGLDLISETEIHSLKAPQSEPLSVLSLESLANGNTLVGTYVHGVYQLSDNQLTPFLSTESGLPAAEVRAILQDKQGGLWFGTPAGLAHYSPSLTQMTLYTKSNSALPDDYVVALAEDELGRVWFGTGIGAGYIEDGQVTALALEQYEQAEFSFGFQVEPGFVWIATDRGLIRFRQSDQSLAIIGRPQGLPIDKFFQVVKDRSGSFWLSSNRGLWRIPYDQAHAVADGKQSHIRFDHFGRSDGMGSSQANGGSNPAMSITDSGQMYIATAHGVSKVTPNHLKQPDQILLPLVIEDVSFDNQSVNPASQHQVPAGTDLIRITYAGLGYSMQNHLEYRTQLIGFEDEWINRGNHNVAEYTNLPPGSYQFRVAARYPYGKWNEADFQYAFHIEPFWWQRSDIRLILSFIALLTLGAIIYLRLYALKQRERQLQQQVQLQTRELRKQSAEFERLSNEDALTGLANRRAFDRALQARLSQPTSETCFSLAIVDIDHFKRINDSFSHLTGDQVIQALSKLLTDNKHGIEMVARWGGEEFACLTSGEGSSITERFERLREAIAKTTITTDQADIHITVSVGIASSHQTHNYKTLLQLADKALYQAKQNGRNIVVSLSQDNASS